MNLGQMQEVLAEIDIRNFRVTIHTATAPLTMKSSAGDSPIVLPHYLYMQGSYREADITTGKEEVQTTRKWLLSEHMVKSEIVQTAFKCYMASMEHRARENFRYKKRRIFGPHFDVESLHGICTDANLDYRE